MLGDSVVGNGVLGGWLVKGSVLEGSVVGNSDVGGWVEGGAVLRGCVEGAGVVAIVVGVSVGGVVGSSSSTPAIDSV